MQAPMTTSVDLCQTGVTSKTMIHEKISLALSALACVAGSLRGCNLSAKTRRTAREAFPRFHIHADRQLCGLLGSHSAFRLCGIFSVFLGSLSVSLCLSVCLCLCLSLSLSLSLCVSLSLSREIEGSKLITRMLLSSFFASFFSPRLCYLFCECLEWKRSR